MVIVPVADWTGYGYRLIYWELTYIFTITIVFCVSSAKIPPAAFAVRKNIYKQTSSESWLVQKWKSKLGKPLILSMEDDSENMWHMRTSDHDNCQAPKCQVPNPLSQKAKNPNPKFKFKSKNSEKTQLFGLGQTQ